jgi:spore maturation protein CgeB
LFEAAACEIPIISDVWPGIDTVFEPGREILLARSSDDVLRFMHDLTPLQRREIGERARERILREHTAEHRAAALIRYVRECQ